MNATTAAAQITAMADTAQNEAADARMRLSTLGADEALALFVTAAVTAAHAAEALRHAAAAVTDENADVVLDLAKTLNARTGRVSALVHNHTDGRPADVVLDLPAALAEVGDPMNLAVQAAVALLAV